MLNYREQARESNSKIATERCKKEANFAIPEFLRIAKFIALPYIIVIIIIWNHQAERCFPDRSFRECKLQTVLSLFH